MMRLLAYNNEKKVYITRDLTDNIPPYAILSHTWGADEEEVTLQELQHGLAEKKAGYRKIQFCGKQARRDGFTYFWVDTCCIDKANHVELSEAITSMFRWYRDAQKCYVYLSDVQAGPPSATGGSRSSWQYSFQNSRWFRRGWTLQELLAPPEVEFYSSEGQFLGTKQTMASSISDITTIPVTALQNTPLAHFSIAERLRWTERRETKKKEDQAYCLLGIFDVFMPLIYGEGDNALRRLQKEINERHGINVVASSSVGGGTLAIPQAFREPDGQNKQFGLCLGDAPQIDSDLFQGRATELEDMENKLQVFSSSTDRRCIVLGGIGGVGKTQIAIAFAHRHRSSYDSVFWLNATSEVTLKTSFRQVAEVILDQQDIAKSKDDELVSMVRQWLSQPNHCSWLMIYDNYDEPDAYDIAKYYPTTTHGSIIVTTRLLARVNGVHVPIETLRKVEDSLAIIQSRSRRVNTTFDPYAHRLAERLDGLPLALATVGAYLERSSWSFERYLEEYEKRWRVNQHIKMLLPEYRDKTLYTTWDLSYRHVQTDSPKAAQLLKLLAYFDNQNIQYDLFQSANSAKPKGRRSKLMRKLFNRRKRSVHTSITIADDVEFESLMAILAQYCFVEAKVEAGSYTLHNCVHDWTLSSLNAVVDIPSYMHAFGYVLAGIKTDDREMLRQVSYAGLALHAARLVRPQFFEDRQLVEAVEDRYRDASTVGILLKYQTLLFAAEQMIQRALAGREKALGSNHTSTLQTVGRLGSIYLAQHEYKKAEQMYQRALAGIKEALGPDNPVTLEIVNNLGSVYESQDRFDEAEQMYQQALTGKERALGPDHPSVFGTVYNLGNLYYHQKKFSEADLMYSRALAGEERVLGPYHFSTLNSIHGLGVLYFSQGKFSESEQLLQRAQAGQEKTIGPYHISTLETVHDLGVLYYAQDRLGEAEELFKRALAGIEKVFGLNHSHTLQIVQSLSCLYHKQDRVEEAEQIKIRHKLTK